MPSGAGYSFYTRFYPCELHRVIDGDTVELRCDLGFRISTVQRFRLNGYNAPEIRGPEAPFGKVAAIDLDNRLSSAVSLEVSSGKQGSFGRWLADIIVNNGEDRYRLVPKLVAEGYGVWWDGKPDRPQFPPGSKYPNPKF